MTIQRLFNAPARDHSLIKQDPSVQFLTKISLSDQKLLYRVDGDIVDDIFSIKEEEEEANCRKQAPKERYWKIPICDDDDDNDYTIAITPVLSTEEPVNSLIMENEHLDTISATESDEFIKSSVEILVPIPISSKVMEIVIPEVGRIEDDILLIKDDTLREKLLNVNRLVAKIKALKDNPVISEVISFQKGQKTPVQNDKTEHQEWKRTVQNQAKVQKKPKVRVNTEESAVKPEPN
ncbi:hypothetical protein Tco_1202381 [Tanacetum coccineum]